MKFFHFFKNCQEIPSQSPRFTLINLRNGIDNDVAISGLFVTVTVLSIKWLHLAVIENFQLQTVMGKLSSNFVQIPAA